MATRLLEWGLFCFLFAPVSTYAVVPVLPQGLTFAPQSVGSTSSPQTMTVYNTGTKNVIVNSLTLIPSQFKLVGGTVPLTVPPGQFANYLVAFAPDALRTFSGKATFNVSGNSTEVSLTGMATSTTARATLSANSLNFGNLPVGIASPAQTLTITNTGTSAFTVNGVTVTFPFFQTGFTKSKVPAGGSVNLQATFFPTLIGSAIGTVLITYDNLAPSGVTLTGTGTAPTAFMVSTFPTLPRATQSAAYKAAFTNVGSVGQVTWTLATGSTLPSGLTLSSAGVISGTLDSTVIVGNYTFTVKATDSNSPPSVATEAVTLPVNAPTGANCNNITFNIAGTNTPLVPINDLATDFYLGVEQGGIYANGSNSDPPDHDSYGANLAAGIQPLDSNGNPSPTGKYVFLSIGHSTSQQAFTGFMGLANADPAKNPSLVIVNGAQGGATAKQLSNPGNTFWTAITNNLLPNAGVTANQVVVAWVNAIDAGMTGTFPEDMTGLQAQLQSIAQNLHTIFPNIKIAYYSSMPYTGYSNGITNLVPEPYGYESGFAVKNAIQDQIDGDPNLNFDPAKGAVLAPWMAWGPYYWANGMLSRSDGLVWTCQDYNKDGTHPSPLAGILDVSVQLLEFLKTDHTATPWFLAH